MFQTRGVATRGGCPCPIGPSVGSVPLSLLTPFSAGQLLLQAINDLADSSAPPPGYEQDSMSSCECLWSHWVGPRNGEWVESFWHPHPPHLPSDDDYQVRFSPVEDSPPNEMLEACLFSVR